MFDTSPLLLTWGNVIYFLWVLKNEPTNYAHLDRHQTLQGGAGLVIVLALFFFGVGLVVPWRGPNGLIKTNGYRKG